VVGGGTYDELVDGKTEYETDLPWLVVPETYSVVAPLDVV
jgi:hypothetical protein